MTSNENDFEVNPYLEGLVGQLTGRRFGVSGERIRYLTPDEEIRLFEQLDSCEWLKQIVLIGLHTGMRRGEICNLQWYDLNFDRGLIHVRNTKNGKDRIIPMNATVRQLLETQKILRIEKHSRMRKKGSPRFQAYTCSRVHEPTNGSLRSNIHSHEL